MFYVLLQTLDLNVLKFDIFEKHVLFLLTKVLHQRSKLYFLIEEKFFFGKIVLEKMLKNLKIALKRHTSRRTD